MEQLAEMLGIDLSSPEMVRADFLAHGDMNLLTELVKVRKERDLRQKDVAQLMGVSQPSVAQFEASGSNPRLSTIRRYAMAVGALIRHQVEADNGQLMDGRWQRLSVAGEPAVASSSAAYTVLISADTIHNTGAARFQGVGPTSQGVAERFGFALAA